MIKSTTNLNKICKLKKRIWALQGSQGSAKTYSVLILLINHAQKHSSKEIYVASKELSKMKITVIKDFRNIMISLGYWNDKNFNKSEYIYLFDNGSFIKFLGLDSEDIGKGLRSDIVFINEANKINFETYRELTSRAKRIILDYNPNSLFWVHSEIIPRNDCDFIKLTFEGNEYLSQEERNEILRYYQQGYNEDGTIKSEYWANIWQVYGLGEVGSVEGRIYYWKSIEYNDYLKIDKTPIYGVDWGMVDPFAVVELKYHDGNLYVHEINYKSENQIRQSLSSTQLTQIKGANDDGLVTWLFNTWGVDKKRMLVCDSNRPNKILSLRNAGWEYAKAVGRKSGLLDRIGMLQGINIYYTNTSKNIEFEQMNFSYEKDKFGNQLETPTDANNHTIDAITYGVQELFNQGIIKNI